MQPTYYYRITGNRARGDHDNPWNENTTIMLSYIGPEETRISHSKAEETKTINEMRARLPSRPRTHSQRRQGLATAKSEISRRPREQEQNRCALVQDCTGVCVRTQSLCSCTVRQRCPTGGDGNLLPDAHQVTLCALTAALLW